MWHSACKIKDIAKGSGRMMEIAGKKVALFNVGGKFHALYGACVHRGGPLGEGYLEGVRVTCPWHAWEFDVKTGDCSTMKGAKQPSFPVKVEKSEVWVDL